ncbi:MAG TPA: sulfurtransferase TusA family protein [Nitrososphaeraceae archaeon]|nr:sulfurtransferase TusA family protein [Nitrososphaeraceae archaeon]
MGNSNSNSNNNDNSEGSNFKKVIDVRGLYCPEPVFRTKIEIEKMIIGDRLKVVADDPQSEEDISRWVNRNGHDLVSINKKESDLEFIIKKAK